MFSYWIEQSKKVNDSYIKKAPWKNLDLEYKEGLFFKLNNQIIAICILYYNNYYLMHTFLDFIERANPWECFIYPFKIKEYFLVAGSS